MGKLVRDRIPEIIEADGKKPITRILPEDEYLQKLDTKLNEEVAEYQADKSIEEMADVLEVLFAICDFIAFGLFVMTEKWNLLPLLLLVTALLVPYIFHYFYLENGVQRLYTLIDEMEKRKER